MKPLVLHTLIGARFLVILALTLASACSASRAAQNLGKGFPTPEAAVSALAEAVQTTNRAALEAIFGPSADDLINPDPVQAANEFATFAAALCQTNHLTRGAENHCVLELGVQAYPFAVPLIRQSGAWFFDTAAGREELRNRRIGRNELSTLQTMRAYVAAQREYACCDRDGSGVLKYAQKLLSGPGKKDGLYWPPELDGEISPIGPLVAKAQQEGYGQKRTPDGPRQPYHGY